MVSDQRKARIRKRAEEFVDALDSGRFDELDRVSPAENDRQCSMTDAEIDAEVAEFDVAYQEVVLERFVEALAAAPAHPPEEDQSPSPTSI